MRVKAFITHKLAETFSDCQDRFNIGGTSIALSDGMGSTWMQKIWAEILVKAYTDDKDGWKPSFESITPLCSDWQNQVKKHIELQKEKRVSESIIYRNERRLIEGDSAGATFVGIRFDGEKWSGTVLGDSCLIEWDGAKATFHTSQDGNTFDNYPDYFDSNHAKRGKGNPKDISGALESNGGALLLVSDPFSDFLLRKNKDGVIEEYLRNIFSITNHNEFEILVKDWRNEGMHNDDSTLIVIEYDGNNELNQTHYDDIHQYIQSEEDELKKATQNAHPSTEKQTS